MKRKIKYAMLISGIIMVAFLSCKKEQQPTVYMGYDYFPNNVGHYVIYECDSIVHPQGFRNLDTVYKYQIKEVIDSMYYDDGQPTMRIVRYKRTNNNIPWSNIFTPEKVWTANLLINNSPPMALRQEDNYVYEKLVFPVLLNQSWNGNARNTLPAYSYQYTAVNTPLTLNNSTGSVYFDSTLTVLQYLSPVNFLNYAYYTEQYATGIGLIYKAVDVDSSSIFGPTQPPDSSLNTTWGVWYTETYLSSGNQ